MNKNFRLIAVILILHLSYIKTSKASNEVGLTQSDIVESVNKHYPQILSYYEKVNAAEGNALSALGFFDIKLKQSYKDKSRGFYDGKISETLIEKDLGFLGSKVYGGYRKSYGSFADYEGLDVTNDGGEYRVGAKFSLLRGSSIDQNRLGVILANLGIEESKIQLETIKKEIRRDATKAYWKWVVAFEVFKIYEELHKLSINRQNQLEQKLEKGDVAQIIVTENKKNILRRKTAMTRAFQDFENSAIYLSLFWRNENGKPLIPKQQHVPKISPNLVKVDDGKLLRDTASAILNRPELRILKIQKEQNSNNLRYSDNLLKPQLDAEFESSKDLGNGLESRSQSNNYVGVSFSIPLQQREAKGQNAKYESNLKSIKYEKLLAEEKIEVELRKIQTRIISVVDIYKNITEESELAKLLESSEREKFKHGASNFFLVNIREQDTAEAKASLAAVYGEYQEALADYKMAVFLD